MRYVTFCIPGEARGKPRPRFNRAGGAFNAPIVKFYEGLVREIAAEAMAGGEPLAGPLSVSVAMWREPPASWTSKRKAEEHWCVSKPDADNMVKMIFDAMNKLVYRDDAQITHLEVTKKYGGENVVDVIVRELEEQ